MSFIEYAVHRWLMHNKRLARKFHFLHSIFDKHAVFHHARFYRDFEFDKDPAAKYINLTFDPFLHVGLSLPVAALFWFISPFLAISFSLIIFLHACLWNIIHCEMHEPKQTWFSKYRLYVYLRNYHKIHHDHPNKNYNVVLPGMDYLFGTYMKVE